MEEVARRTARITTGGALGIGRGAGDAQGREQEVQGPGGGKGQELVHDSVVRFG